MFPNSRSIYVFMILLFIDSNLFWNMKILGTNHLVLTKIVIKKVFDSGNFYNWNSLGECERNKIELKKTLFAKTNFEQSKTNCNFRRDFLVEKN